MSIKPNKKQIDNSYMLSFFFRTYMKFKNFITSDDSYAKNTFFKIFQKELNLENPKTFNEKMQWLKLYDRTPLHTMCADKIAVRAYVKDKIGEEYLIPLEKVFLNTNDLKPENLPKYPVIIKCNHNSSAYTIVQNKDEIDWSKERLKYANLLKQNYYYQGREWQYKNIEPTLFAEKLLTDSQGNIPNDYKIFCFDGQSKFIQVDIGRQSLHFRNFYDTKWNLLPIKISLDNGNTVEKPTQLNLMLELANKLSKDFVFARVDFYTFGNKVFFGEITFHPDSGFSVFKDEKHDNDIGDYLILKKII